MTADAELADHYRDILAALRDAVLLSRDGVVVDANAAAGSLFGVGDGARLVGRRLAELLPDLDGGERAVTGADGVERRAELAVVAGGGGDVVVVASDVTELRRSQAALDYHAAHDPLTGLANRDRLRQELERALAGPGAVLALLDLDRFRVVNDGRDHAVGDDLLAQVAGRLTAAAGSGALVARFGGAVFAVVSAPAASGELAHALSSVFTEPFMVGDDRFHLAASVGVAEATRPGLPADELLRRAETAMYRAKAAGGGRTEAWDEETGARLRARHALERALRHALERDELRLHYQPIVEAATGRPVAVEALLRWEHPEQGLLAPGAFIPIAEETGMIVPIGAWVLGEACRQAARWAAAVPVGATLHVSVNLAARQVAEPGLVEAVAAVLDRDDVRAGALSVWLEVTESTLMDDPARTSEVLAELQALGIHVVIDDFGTGYSSLAYLKAFPVAALKIDRSFVAGLGSDSDDDAIVAAVVDLAHALGLGVVAEGVETEQQRDRLRTLGCDLLQGFLFARPAPAEDLDGLLGRPFDLAVGL